jgi:hypothetical protein
MVLRGATSLISCSVDPSQSSMIFRFDWDKGFSLVGFGEFLGAFLSLSLRNL